MATQTQLSESLYPALYRAFHQKGKRLRFNQGQIIVAQNQTLDYLGILIEGTAEAYITSATGDTYIAEQLPTGWVFNAACYLDDGKAPAEAIAAEDCILLTLPYSFLRRDPILHAEATQLVAHNVVQLYRIAENLFTSAMLLSLDTRILKRLNRLKDDKNQVTITTDKLANYLGVSKYKVYRELKKLEQQGCISTGYGSITLNASGLLD